ncbi:MAG: hypothetical protein ABIN83_01310 [Sphingomicrobium sp.]
MPNLKTDRLIGLAVIRNALNVRRLMYQSLIWVQLWCHEPGGLRAPLDAQNVERAANALIDSVG